MSNERITENFVRDDLHALGYYGPDSDIQVDEQSTTIPAIRRLLRGASKTGGTGMGAPEFIVTSLKVPDFVLLIECKADRNKHETPDHSDPVGYAVDGVLVYAKAVSKEFHVIAVAVSGSKRSSLKVSTFLHPKGAEDPQELSAPSGAALDRIVSLDNYIQAAEYDPAVEKARVADLMAFSKSLHDFMRDYGKLTEAEKPLLVSGTLLALRNQAFAKGYGDYKPAELQKQWLRVIQDELESADIPGSKKQNMVQPYSTIGVHPELGVATKTHPKGVLYELIDQLAKNVLPLITIYHDYDVVGSFYGEFLRYTGGDKKALGIVLTPRHITELFARLANVSMHDIVLDPCAGTGGFLISAMSQMLRDALTEEERIDIRQHRLIGIEQQPSMYALAASNMILRGDGKANLHQGSCFDDAITKVITAQHPTVGFVNPPYSQKGEGLSELSFVKHMLDMLVPGGTGIAIVPMSCATAPSEEKVELLASHTLEAVMSMPNEVFSPVGVITCIMVFTAHTPHATSNKKSWFGYWRDDGFIKTKHLGRIDPEGKWPAIRDHWVESYRNREVIVEESVSHQVTAEDEWCAEAYLETDYSVLTEADFAARINEHLLANLELVLQGSGVDDEEGDEEVDEGAEESGE